MEKTSTLVNNVFTNTKDFVQLKSKSVKLEFYAKSAGAVAGATNGAILTVLGLCAFFFLNVGLAFAMGEVFNSLKWGFLSVGGIYVLVFAIFFAVKKSLATTVMNKALGKLSQLQYTDYERLLVDKNLVDAQLERAETLVKANIEELKDNLEVVAEDFKRLKHDVQRFRQLFGSHDDGHETGLPNSAGQGAKNNMTQNDSESPSAFQKIAVASVAEFLINRFVLKDVNSLKKIILPALAKVFVSNGLSNKGNAATSPHQDKPGAGNFLDTLKKTLAKFL